MVRGRYLEGNTQLGEVLSIRKQVIGEELGMPQAAAECPEDMLSVHAVAFDDANRVVAIGSMHYEGEGFTISRVAVLPEYRKQYYGDFILKMLIDRAALANATEIYARVICEAAQFMETVGFSVEGVAQIEEGREILTMKIGADRLGCHACQSK
mgnify:CR=1 FL=1